MGTSYPNVIVIWTLEPLIPMLLSSEHGYLLSQCYCHLNLGTSYPNVIVIWTSEPLIPMLLSSEHGYLLSQCYCHLNLGTSYPNVIAIIKSSEHGNLLSQCYCHLNMGTSYPNVIVIWIWVPLIPMLLSSELGNLFSQCYCHLNMGISYPNVIAIIIRCWYYIIHSCFHDNPIITYNLLVYFQSSRDFTGFAILWINRHVVPWVCDSGAIPGLAPLPRLLRVRSGKSPFFWSKD